MAFTKIAAAGIGSTETVTLHSLEVLNNATVGGVLTYEDVTNVDSIGLITARNGIVVGSGITLSKDGDIFATGVTTATSFVGDGSQLTGVASTENIRTNTNATFLQNINVSGTSTVGGDVNIADKIVHIGDTNTAIRFPSNDIFTVETAGTERIRCDGDGVKIPDKLIHLDDTDTIIRFPSNDTFSVETAGTERLRIDSSGRVLIGTNAHNGTYDGITPQVVLEGTSYNTSTLTLFCNANSAGDSPQLQLGKSRGTSDGATTIVQDDDRLAAIWIVGADGTDRNSSFAALDFKVDGTPGANDTPGRIEFKTTSSGDSNPSEKVRITSGGELWVGTTSGISNSGYGGFSLNGSSGSLLSLMHNGTEKLRLFGNTNPSIQYAGDLTFYSGVSGGTERVRIKSNGKFWLTGADLSGNVSFPSSSSGARVQIGAHTFQGSDAVYDNNRLGMQINGNLSASIMLADTYNNASYPGYGYVMVQGPSTSDYVTYAICPDGPAKGNNLNFHIGEEQTNIHSNGSVRQVWFNASGNAYKRDNTGNWSTQSDERLKKNIVDNNKGLAEINQLRVTSFEYRKQEEIDMSQFPLASIPQDVVIEGHEGPHTGVIAQEIESIFPECVQTSNKGAKTVDADAITWALVNAIKELSAKNDALEARISELEG